MIKYTQHFTVKTGVYKGTGLIVVLRQVGQVCDSIQNLSGGWSDD